MTTVDVNALAGLPDAVKNELFWRLVWPRIKEARWKGNLWIFRPSVQVGHLKPLFETIFGPAPTDA